MIVIRMARTVASIVRIVARMLRRITGMRKIATWMVSIIRMVVGIVSMVLRFIKLGKMATGWPGCIIWYSYLFYGSFGSAYIYSSENKTQMTTDS